MPGGGGKLVEELKEAPAETEEPAETKPADAIALQKTEAQAKLIDPEYEFVLKVDNGMCCRFNNCSVEYKVDCQNWFSNGIDPGEVEARKEADQRNAAALAHIEIANKADANRGNMTAAEETASLVADEKKRNDELLAE